MLQQLQQWSLIFSQAVEEKNSKLGQIFLQIGPLGVSSISMFRSLRMSRILSAAAKSLEALAASRSDTSKSISSSESTVSFERPRTSSSSDTVVKAIDASLLFLFVIVVCIDLGIHSLAYMCAVSLINFKRVFVGFHMILLILFCWGCL